MKAAIKYLRNLG